MKSSVIILVSSLPGTTRNEMYALFLNTDLSLLGEFLALCYSLFISGAFFFIIHHEFTQYSNLCNIT
jgi:hypothetical protein